MALSRIRSCHPQGDQTQRVRTRRNRQTVLKRKTAKASRRLDRRDRRLTPLRAMVCNQSGQINVTYAVPVGQAESSIQMIRDTLDAAPGLGVFACIDQGDPPLFRTTGVYFQLIVL